MRRALPTTLAAVGLVAFASKAGAVTICLLSFCQTFECGLDNFSVVTCLYDHDCTGEDLEPAIGTIQGTKVSVSGEIDAIGEVFTFDIDIPARTAKFYFWDGIGTSFLQNSASIGIGAECTE